MLIQIIHIFYYHGGFQVLDVEFMKSKKYLNFCGFKWLSIIFKSNLELSST